MAKKATHKKAGPVKIPTERIPTGIPGLDGLIEGGLVRGSTILVTGGTGTGKTTFCAQFILEGLKKGEPGIYMTLEEDPEDIKEDLKKYGFDFETYEKSGIFKFVYQNPFEVSDISSTIVNVINSINAKRIVIDPISLVGMYMKDPAVLRKRLFEIIRILRKTNTTTMITSEILDEALGIQVKSLSRFGVVEFVADGIIVLNLFGVGGGITRSLLVRKMRRTKHGTDVYPMGITSKGIIVGKNV
ncbi:MAG: ATPase domain-containing protein [Candidatus Aenigmarchaeota archaeon]